MDGVTYSNSSGDWNTSAGSFYWPVKGELNFYCYAPETPGKTGAFSIDPSSQKLTGFAPFPTAAQQQDLVYAKATGSLAANATSGLDVNFSHALSEITIAAKNTNTAYTVEVSGVKLGNVISEGDFTFPSVAGSDASWSLGTERSDYTTEWQNATTLSSTVSSLDASNTAFMLLPQQLSAQAKAIEGNYIALKVKITMQGGQVVHDGWAYVAIPTLWEMNKHYAYTLDFSEGAGQDENGNDIISGSQIKLNVTVTPWDEENIKLLRQYISGVNRDDYVTWLNINGVGYPTTPNENGYWEYDVTDFHLTNLYGIFRGSWKTISMNLSKFDTRNVTNMQDMFQQCSSLQTLDLSNFDTRNVTNMNGMFQQCSSLQTLDLSNFDTRNVTNMNGMFYCCISLKSLDLSGWNTENVTNMGWMFDRCSSLSSLNLSGWNTENVTNMEGMFQQCNSLQMLDMSNFNTSYVTDMSQMFDRCSSLSSLNLSGWNTENVTNMEGMFQQCNSLQTLDLSNFNTSNVTDMSQMFYNCSSLETLDLSNWNTSKVTNMGWMFNNCSSLETLDLSNFDTSNVTSLNRIFNNCSSLESLDLSGWDTRKVTDMSQMFYNCSSLETLDLSNWRFPTKKLGWGLLYGCTNLKNIYMVGCNETTINKIKDALTDAGLSTDIVKTTK